MGGVEIQVKYNKVTYTANYVKKFFLDFWCNTVSYVMFFNVWLLWERQKLHGEVALIGEARNAFLVRTLLKLFVYIWLRCRSNFSFPDSSNWCLKILHLLRFAQDGNILTLKTRRTRWNGFGGFSCRELQDKLFENYVNLQRSQKTVCSTHLMNKLYICPTCTHQACVLAFPS